MGSVTGNVPLMPRRLTQLAVERAIEHGWDVMGDAFLLLAMLELEPGQPARRALEAEGMTGERLANEIHAYGDASAEKPRGVTYSPASYIVQGRAQGFAAALGDGAITPEHVLLALLWDPTSMSSYVLWRLDVARDRLLARLRDDGVAVPSAALPPQREIEWGPKVWFDRRHVTIVLDHVRLHLSPETTWGFNYENDRAWVVAEASVDLQALVKDSLTDK